MPEHMSTIKHLERKNSQLNTNQLDHWGAPPTSSVTVCQSDSYQLLQSVDSNKVVNCSKESLTRPNISETLRFKDHWTQWNVFRGTGQRFCYWNLKVDWEQRFFTPRDLSFRLAKFVRHLSPPDREFEVPKRSDSVVSLQNKVEILCFQICPRSSDGRSFYRTILPKNDV